MTHVPHSNLAVAARLVEPTWRASACCRDSDAVHFFAPSHFERKPEKDRREGAARALCAACPVRQQCLDYALLVQEPHGIWGGMNEMERRRLLRQRAAEAEPLAGQVAGSVAMAASPGRTEGPS